MKPNAFQPLPVEPIKRVALRPNEAAASLGVCQRTLATWLKLDGFPVVRVGGVVLVPIAELQQWLSDRLEAGEVAESEVTR